MKRRAVLGVFAVLVFGALVAARADARPRATLATTVTLKMLVNKDGWYRVPASTIAPLFTPSSWSNVHLSTGPQGVPGVQDVPYQESGGTLEFYGQGLDPPSSQDLFLVSPDAVYSTRTYWLWESNTTAGSRLPAPVAAGGPTTPPSGTYQVTLNARDRQSYYASVVNGPETTLSGPGNSYFGNVAVTSTSPDSRAITLSNADVTQAATLRVDLRGYQTPLYPGTSHSINVALNGTNLGSVAGSGSFAALSASFAVPPNLLVNGSNTVALTNPGTTNAVLTDTYSLTYRHLFFADGDALDFPVTPTQALSVGGFSANDVRVADITIPSSPRELLPTVSSGSPFTIGITPPLGANRLYAFTGAKMLAPTQVFQDTPSNLRATSNQADLIVISHANFRSAVQPLVNLRISEGLAVTVVDVQDVYDEFGSSLGAKDPNSIRAFLQYAKNNWASLANPDPKYVLLVGDASLDARNYLGFGGPDFIPTTFVNATFPPEPPSDDSLADFSPPSGDGRPELAVGRLPVNTVAETSAMVTKIVNHASAPATAKTALLVSDNHDRNDYLFRSFSDDMQNTSLVPNGVSVTRINRTDFPPANPNPGSDQDVNNQVVAAASTGPMIVNWFGHGRIHAWAGSPPLLQASNAPSLTNAGKLSLYLMMTCQNAYFVDPTFSSLGEALLRAANGAVAVWGSSGDTVPTDQVKSAKLATQELFRPGSSRRLGDALLVTKGDSTVTDIDVLHTWTLLGDPTTRLTAGPTSVMLQSFTAARSARGVELRWRTASESDVLGFNVYRFVGGTKVKLNRGLIAAKQSGKARGAAYKVVDRQVRRNASSTYRLQVISLTGKRSWVAASVVRPTS